MAARVPCALRSRESPLHVTFAPYIPKLRWPSKLFTEPLARVRTHRSGVMLWQRRRGRSSFCRAGEPGGRNWQLRVDTATVRDAFERCLTLPRLARP